jgi:hypothetical protein
VRKRLRSDQSVRKMAKKLGVSRCLLQTYVKNDLKLNSYKKQKVHGLIEAHKTARVQKCQHLLAWHVGVEINFSDVKLFLLLEPLLIPLSESWYEVPYLKK